MFPFKFLVFILGRVVFGLFVLFWFVFFGGGGCLPVSQYNPVKPTEHSQVKLAPSLMHVMLLLQGLPSHGLTSGKQEEIYHQGRVL